jgi:hypothetical protein
MAGEGTRPTCMCVKYVLPMISEEGVGVGVGVGGLVGSVLGIGWLGWQLGGTADFDAFRAVCMHSLQLQMPDC